MMYIKKIIPSILIMVSIFSPGIARPQASAGYSLKGERIVISAGRAVSANYSIKHVILGNFFGGRATSGHFILDAYYDGVVSTYMCPLDLALDVVPSGEPVITSPDKKITLENNGDAVISCSLRTQDPLGFWSASETSGELGENGYRLSAVFTGNDVKEVVDGDFNEYADDDIVPVEPRLATEKTFATSLSMKNGIAIAPHEKRALWLKFEAPKIDTTQEEKHNLWLIIEAREVN